MNVYGIQTTLGEDERLELDRWAEKVLRTGRAGAMRVAIRYALENRDQVAQWLDGAEQRARAESAAQIARWARGEE